MVCRVSREEFIEYIRSVVTSVDAVDSVVSATSMATSDAVVVQYSSAHLIATATSDYNDGSVSSASSSSFGFRC